MMVGARAVSMGLASVLALLAVAWQLYFGSSVASGTAAAAQSDPLSAARAATSAAAAAAAAAVPTPQPPPPARRCFDGRDPATVLPPVAPYKFKRIDRDGHVRFAKRFLSRHEVAYMLELVAATGGWEASPTGGPHYEVPSRKHRVGAGAGAGAGAGRSGGGGGVGGVGSSAFEETVRADAIVARIEERIGEATGIAVHPHEDLLSLARLTSRGTTPRAGNFAPFGLHHETDTRPHRARTVLVYLAAPGHGGGHTIFPCLEPRRKVARRQQLGQAHGKGQVAARSVSLAGGAAAAAAAAAAALAPETAAARRAREVRKALFVEALGTQWGGQHNDWQRHVAFDIEHEHPFNELLADVCAGREGVSVAPRVGGALLWDSLVLPRELAALAAAENPRPLPRLRSCNVTWHAGCNVLRGGTKIMMQKFKELPAALRSPGQGPNGDNLAFPYNPYVPA